MSYRKWLLYNKRRRYARYMNSRGIMPMCAQPSPMQRKCFKPLGKRKPMLYKRRPMPCMGNSMSTLCKAKWRQMPYTQIIIILHGVEANHPANGKAIKGILKPANGKGIKVAGNGKLRHLNTKCGLLKANIHNGIRLPDLLRKGLKVNVNIPLVDVINRVPKYAKFLKDLCTIKRKFTAKKSEVFLMEQASSVTQSDIPPKYKDPGCPTISVHLLPYSLYEKLDLGELKPTRVTLQLADRSVCIPRGLLEDVLVRVEDFVYPMDFVVLDTCPAARSVNQTPIILGRPFLATSRAIMDCRTGLCSMAHDNLTMVVNVFNVNSSIGDDDDFEDVSVIDSLVHEHIETVLCEDSLEICLTAKEAEFLDSPEVGYFCALLDSAEVCGPESWSPKFEELPPLGTKTLPSNVLQPKPGLKALPKTLKYAFLGGGDTFPVVLC